MKRMLIGLVLTAVFYFVGCMLTGAVVGGIAGARDPQNASVVGAQAGHEAVVKYRLVILAGAIALGVCGANVRLRPAAKAAGDDAQFKAFGTPDLL